MRAVEMNPFEIQLSEEIHKLREELKWTKALKDDLLLLHERTVKFVLPGLMDSPGAYRKILKDTEKERDRLRAALEKIAAPNPNPGNLSDLQMLALWSDIASAALDGIDAPHDKAGK